MNFPPSNFKLPLERVSSNESTPSEEYGTPSSDSAITSFFSMPNDPVDSGQWPNFKVNLSNVNFTKSPRISKNTSNIQYNVTLNENITLLKPGNGTSSLHKKTSFNIPKNETTWEQLEAQNIGYSNSLNFHPMRGNSAATLNEIRKKLEERRRQIENEKKTLASRSQQKAKLNNRVDDNFERGDYKEPKLRRSLDATEIPSSKLLDKLFFDDKTRPINAHRYSNDSSPQSTTEYKFGNKYGQHSMKEHHINEDYMNNQPIAIEHSDNQNRGTTDYGNSLDRLNNSLSELQGQIMHLSLQQDQMKSLVVNKDASKRPSKTEPKKFFLYSDSESHLPNHTNVPNTLPLTNINLPMHTSIQQSMYNTQFQPQTNTMSSHLSVNHRAISSHTDAAYSSNNNTNTPYCVCKGESKYSNPVMVSSIIPPTYQIAPTLDIRSTIANIRPTSNKQQINQEITIKSQPKEDLGSISSQHYVTLHNSQPISSSQPSHSDITTNESTDPLVAMTMEPDKPMVDVPSPETTLVNQATFFVIDSTPPKRPKPQLGQNRLKRDSKAMSEEPKDCSAELSKEERVANVELKPVQFFVKDGEDESTENDELDRRRKRLVQLQEQRRLQRSTNKNASCDDLDSFRKKEIRQQNEQKKQESRERRATIFKDYMLRKEELKHVADESTRPIARRPRPNSVCGRGGNNRGVVSQSQTREGSPNRKEQDRNNGRMTNSGGSDNYSDYGETGSLKLFVKPSQRSNKNIIINSLKDCCLAGSVNHDTKLKVLELIEPSDAKHFLVLLREVGLQYRALYTYAPERSGEILKLHGIGPRSLTDRDIEKFYKYNSGGKNFSEVRSTKHLSSTIDAIVIFASLLVKQKAPALR